MSIETIDDRNFKKFQDMLYNKTGIFLPDTKKILVTSRLMKRMKQIDIKEYTEYFNLCMKDKKEKWECIEILTTNETYFFREHKHLDILKEYFYPEFLKQSPKELKIWSAACSTGEEPYTLSIFFQKLFKDTNIKIKIIASDINSKVVDIAKTGIYKERSFRATYSSTLAKNFIKQDKYYKVKDEVKKCIDFRIHNIMKPFREKKFDIIFLRNVLIYFNNESRKKVIKFIIDNNLKNGGYFVLGLSENIIGLDIKNLKIIKHSVYQKI